MDVDKLTKLALRDGDVRELLHKWMAAQKENETLSVALMKTRLEESNRVNAQIQGRLDARIAALEERVDSSSDYTRKLVARIRALENGKEEAPA